MRRKGRQRGPADDVLLVDLDQLVKVDGIVKAADRLGMTYRTGSNCLESRHVSRKMRDALGKHLREQTERTEESKEQGIRRPRQSRTFPRRTKRGVGRRVPACRTLGRPCDGRSRPCGRRWCPCANGWRRSRVSCHKDKESAAATSMWTVWMLTTMASNSDR